MDLGMKKPKVEENGAAGGFAKLSSEEAKKFIEPLSADQLRDIVAGAISGDDLHGGGSAASVIDTVRAIADRDVTRRKLFVRGLGWDTTTDGLRSFFSVYGDLEDAVVVPDKATGRSRGYGFVIFRHADGALLALREPSKKIDGRVAVTQYADATLAAAAGAPPAAHGSAPAALDTANRKLYVGGVPPDMPPERLLAHFLSYGDIEEGPLGYDRNTGKSRGYAMFVYKTAEGAAAALVDPMKNIDGNQLPCKLAYDNKKGKPGSVSDANLTGAAPVAGSFHGQAMGGGAGGPDMPGDGMGLAAQSSRPSVPFSSQYGAPGGITSFGGYHGGSVTGSAGGVDHHLNHGSSLPLSMVVGSQLPSGIGGSGNGGGYGAGLAGTYGSGGYGGYGMGSSGYRLPAGSSATAAGGYPDSGSYGMSSNYQGQHNHHPGGSSPGARVPTGGSRLGMYSGNMGPPYF